jgi:uncharacterized protein YcgL (UPF0745 family)
MHAPAWIGPAENRRASVTKPPPLSPPKVCGDNPGIPERRAMQAHVYKSLRKPDTYLYLREKDAFLLVPDSVRVPLGELQFVLSVDLVPGRRLARVEADTVRANLAAVGFHLQGPQTMDDPLVAGGVGDG